MKSQDLRIGNWIYESKATQFPMQVEAIFQDGTLYLNFEGNEGDVWDCNVKDIEAIPLTNEILLKCGFEKIGMAYIKGMFIINGRSDGRFQLGNSGMSVELTFLHQLQNLFYSLTGKELEVEL